MPRWGGSSRDEARGGAGRRPRAWFGDGVARHSAVLAGIRAGAPWHGGGARDGVAARGGARCPAAAAERRGLAPASTYRQPVGAARRRAGAALDRRGVPGPVPACGGHSCAGSRPDDRTAPARPGRRGSPGAAVCAGREGRLPGFGQGGCEGGRAVSSREVGRGAWRRCSGPRPCRGDPALRRLGDQAVCARSAPFSIASRSFRSSARCFDSA